MPNWVQINLHFKGEDSKIKEMLEKFKDDEAGFGSIDFNKIAPMPKSLNIECGSKTDDGIEMVKEYLKNVPKEFQEKEGSYDDFFGDLKKHGDEILNPDKKEIWELGVKAASNIVKYDAPTWYEWCIKNWGAKWNACGYDGSPPEFENNCISFQTAWDAPLPIVKKMSEMYPDLEFTMEYADEDIGHNCGRYTFKGGNLTNLFKPKEGREAYEFTAKIWDYDLSDYSLHLNIPRTAYVYTGDDDKELIELFGKPALYVNERLKPEDIPYGLNLYHIRRSDDDDRFAALEPEVRVNHGGSVITTDNIDFGEEGYIEFTEETEPNFLGQIISIDDYVSENFTIEESEEQTGGMNLCQ